MRSVVLLCFDRETILIRSSSPSTLCILFYFFGSSLFSRALRFESIYALLQTQASDVHAGPVAVRRPVESFSLFDHAVYLGAPHLQLTTICSVQTYFPSLKGANGEAFPPILRAVYALDQDARHTEGE